ncbi:4552_t:CDS:2 [Funneliformis mosseae]|uniref:Mediator of RNA polymerase II transcription subunit 6 n=1 Tax=Funneliformis mosseae TaxID=27381 RepID=A0A9N9E798_FUNMO|nr:4552_t:CDS:2 [Funneliformis mosseae]
MVGIEFQVIFQKPPVLWVIRKQNRTDEVHTSPIATYYILNNNIYQAPDLYSVIGSRILTSLHHLHIAFNTAHQEVEFHPATGYTWKGEADSNSALRRSKIQDPKELIEFHSSIERTINNVTMKMHQQLSQAIIQTEEDNTLAINELNDLLISGTPGEMSDQSPSQSSSQPMVIDQMGKRRKKSEDSGKKKKKKQSG